MSYCLRLFLAAALLAFIPSANAISGKQVEQNAPAVGVEQFKNFEGEYTSKGDPDTPLSVYVQGGKLFVESERRVPAELTPKSATEFDASDSHATVRFATGAEGRATGFVLGKDKYKRTGDSVRHVFHDYVRSEAMIPMRDGVKLHVVILKPADIKTPLPFLIQRTPYGVDKTSREWLFSARPELARDGYIYVGEDLRGHYGSEGEFVMMRPLVDHSNRKAIDESTDAYDTVEWLLKNVSGNNGRAGFIGASYPGFLTMMSGIDPHPAVKAISPQAIMLNVWKGDDFFHNGAFRQSYGHDYVYSMESSKNGAEVSYGKDASGKAVDGYDFFLKYGSFAEVVKHSSVGALPTWKLFLREPEYGPEWSRHSVERALNKVTVPTLIVGGYYDQEDMYGSQVAYSLLEPHDTKHENFLVLGPWRHVSWASSARHLGNLEYGAPIGKEYRTQIEAKFFGHYLKDEAGFDLEDTASFQTGSNTWQRYSSFPPKNSHTESLYLGASGALGWTVPSAAQTSYVSDPANPVPYRKRPIQPTYDEGSKWYTWLLEDQRFLAGRADVATWKLPVLEKDLTLTGEVIADIFAATTGTDNDLVVKLIDEYPADDADAKMRGYQLMTNAEIFRGRYLDSFSKPEALKAGAAREYKFSLHDVDHVFKAGHRIVVQVQSSWFPLYDRNPQSFVKNIMTAKPADYKPATITVYGGPEHGSRLLLPVVAK